MELAITLLTAFTASVQSILKQKYNDKAKDGTFIFCAVSSLFACLFFICSAKDFSFQPQQLLMSLAFATAYCTTVISSFMAIKTGPLAKTNLIIQYSLLLPTFFGIIFMNDKIKSTLFIGIAFLAVALFMTNYVKKKDGEKEENVSVKWIIYVLIAFLGNGMCSITQIIETKMYGDSGKSMFMIIALAAVSVFFTVCTLCKRSERLELKNNLKCGWWIATLCGIANGLTNFLVLYLLSINVPASVMNPIISAGGMLFVFLYSVILLKEKYTTVQKIGYVLGILSIVLLNL